MKCHHCQEDKLSKEFPFYPLTEDCNHALLHCLDVSMTMVVSSFVYGFCNLSTPFIYSRLTFNIYLVLYIYLCAVRRGRVWFAIRTAVGKYAIVEEIL